MGFEIVDGELTRYIPEAGETQITIPPEVRKIGSFAFDRCGDLNEVMFCTGLEEIGDAAFGGCYGLTCLTLPEGLLKIGDHAFQCCTSLKEITLPKTVKDIHEAAFAFCSDLERINVREGNQFYASDSSGVLFTSDKTWLLKYPEGASRDSYNIPDTVVNVGSYAFYSTSYLSHVRVPRSVRTVHKGAFANSELKSIFFEPGTVAFGNGVFVSCWELENVNLPDTLQYIGDACFAGCRTMNTLTLPESLVYIGCKCFAHCAALRTLQIPDLVHFLRNHTFFGCSSLRSLSGEGVEAFDGEAALPETMEHLYFPKLTPFQKNMKVYEGILAVIGALRNWKDIDEEMRQEYMKFYREYRRDVLQAIADRDDGEALAGYIQNCSSIDLQQMRDYFSEKERCNRVLDMYL